jgi:hypothetical protein
MPSREEDPVASFELDAVRIRREALYQAMIGLEDALQTPIGDSERWRLRVIMAVEHATNRIQEHVREVEASGGFLDQVTTDHPRLVGRTDDLRHEHARLMSDAEKLRLALTDIEPIEVREREASLRSQALGLLGLLARNRQRGADLIYEAYLVDIGDH